MLDLLSSLVRRATGLHQKVHGQTLLSATLSSSFVGREGEAFPPLCRAYLYSADGTTMGARRLCRFNARLPTGYGLFQRITAFHVEAA